MLTQSQMCKMLFYIFVKRKKTERQGEGEIGQVDREKDTGPGYITKKDIRRERRREMERETDKQTDRQTDRQVKDGQIENERYKRKLDTWHWVTPF